MLEELLTIIRFQNQKTKINIEQLTNLSNITIDNLEFTTLLQNSMTAIQKANFIIEYKKEVPKIDVNHFDDNQLNQITEKFITFSSTFSNNELKYNLQQLLNDYFEKNKTVQQTKLNKQQNCYLTSQYNQFNNIIGGIKNGELIIYSADSAV